MATLIDFPRPKTTPDQVEKNWVCGPCGQTRDSDALARSNFEAVCSQLDTLDPHGNDWDVLRFGHWAVGWIDEIFVRPDSECAALCAQLKEQLADYACLDESLWIQMDDEDKANAAT